MTTQQDRYQDYLNAVNTALKAQWGQSCPLTHQRLVVNAFKDGEAVTACAQNLAAALAIATLNDAFRRTMRGGRVLVTSGIRERWPDAAAILGKVRAFSDFSDDNDPYGEHDFGAFEHEGQKLFWKIDYYAPDMEHGSEDPADPEHTRRVLTVMLAGEW